MSTCNNCGHESHCELPLKKEMLDGDRNSIIIEVCNKCRCSKCWRPDWQEKKMTGIDCINDECKNPLCDCDPCDCSEENPCICCLQWDGE